MFRRDPRPQIHGDALQEPRLARCLGDPAVAGCRDADRPAAGRVAGAIDPASLAHRAFAKFSLFRGAPVDESARHLKGLQAVRVREWTQGGERIERSAGPLADSPGDLSRALLDAIFGAASIPRRRPEAPPVPEATELSWADWERTVAAPGQTTAD